MKKRIKQFIFVFLSAFMILSQAGNILAIKDLDTKDLTSDIKLTTDKLEYSVSENIQLKVTGIKQNVENFKLNQIDGITIESKDITKTNEINFTLSSNKKGNYRLSGSYNDKAIVANEITVNSNKEDKVSGDDPGVTISASNPIESTSQVELKVTLSGSAGKLNEDGKITVTIPKNIVRDPSEIASKLVIGDPFKLGNPAYIDDGKGNYVLNIEYDASKIDQSNAVGYTFEVKFTSPYFVDTSVVGDTVDFNTDLIVNDNTISSDKATSETKPNQPSVQPQFTKYSSLPHKDVDGQGTYLLDTAQNTKANKFIIIVNYNRKAYDDVTINDQLPADTTLYDADPLFQGIPGDSTPIQHLNIYKVVAWNADGSPAQFQYITSNFASDITTTTNSLSVHLGKLTSDDAYVITYGLNVDPLMTPEKFGVRYNDAQEIDSGKQISEVKVPVTIDEDQYQAIKLGKEVSQKTLASKSGEIQYTLTLSSSSGTIPQGTVITDPLPQFTTYKSTIKYDPAYISAANYDSSTNTVSYTLLKDINEGDLTKITFAVDYDNPNALPDDEIVNKAYMEYAGTKIYSSDATTTLAGSAILYKSDADTKDALQGAEFKIIDSAGKTVVQGLVSDINGIINSGLLSTGNYSFVEVKAPIGYVLDTTPIPFTVKEGMETPVNLSMINKLVLGSVQLTKTDKETNKVLQGAVFELQDKDGNVIKSNLTTDENGKIIVKDLKYGEYQFVEVKAPTGYVEDTTPIPFTIKKGDETLVKVGLTNQIIKGDVQLTKVDEKSKAALKGAVFNLLDKDGKIIQKDLVTDENGIILVSDLAYGDYQFVETQAPTGYELDTTPLPFSIKNLDDAAVKVSMSNKAVKGGIVLEKRDEKTKELLVGAIFDLQDENHNVIIKNMKTDQSGKIAVNDLSPGTYYFVETKAPEGYILNSNPIKFEVDAKESSNQTIQITNKEINHSLRVVKKDKKDKTNLSDAQFSLFDENGKVIKTKLTTNQDGVFLIKDFNIGEYYLVETKAPEGYILDSKEYKFSIKANTKLITLEIFNVQKTAPNKVDKTPPTSSVYLPKTGDSRLLVLVALAVIALLLMLIKYQRRHDNY
ncbi:MSCRAMM family protein [Mycoplasma sp. P36-A1]|uniref:MSCRAMM family protein n=1 Tax=Mycoplasma sp. P36-A1 TaxID=3252900 RepID=UPI003C2B578A